MENKEAELEESDFILKNSLQVDAEASKRRSDSKRLYRLDENVFETLNEESAYWLGFIYADGHLGHPNGSGTYFVSIGLNEKDWEHLEKFKAFVKTNKPLQLDNINRATVITVFSRKMYLDIVKYGITANKTYEVHLDPILQYNRDFWRGVIDGDGTVSFVSHSNKILPPKPYPSLRLAGNDNILDYFYNYCKAVDDTISFRKYPRPGTAGSIVISHNAEHILDALYKDSSIYLERKKKLILR